jgi:transglutaminase/protease-like cytokinesis protein 3
MIFYWITINIDYDTVAYFSKDYKDQSAEGVFRTRKSVCAGCANLYKYLSDQLQMPCEIVSGYSKGYGFDNQEEAPSETDHAWNAVEIDNHWYLMESTWGAGHLDERKQFNRELTTYYFLPRPTEMIYHHLPEDEKWQLLRTPIKVLQFMQIPKLRPIYFELNLQLIQPRNQYFVKMKLFSYIDEEYRLARMVRIILIIENYHHIIVNFST